MPGELTMAGRECSPAGMDCDMLAARHAFLRNGIASAIELRDTMTVEQKPPFCSILLPLRRLFQQLQEELEAYINVEEQELLPILRALDEQRHTANDATETIRFLRHGQAALISVLAEMSEITPGFLPPRGGCASYIGLLDVLTAIQTELLLQFQLENDRVFPNAMRLPHRQYPIPEPQRTHRAPPTAGLQ